MSFPGDRATAIVLSYGRPQNIARIVGQLRLASRVGRIVVSNNNPAIDLSAWLEPTPAVEMVQQPLPRGCSNRFEMAARDDAPWFICIDDDLFLTSVQIDALLEALARDARVPHGVWGETLHPGGGRLEFRSGIHGAETTVDVINRCYAFSRLHAARFMQLANLLGREPGTMAFGPGDDIVLSCTGEASPLCHDLGELVDCPTGNDPAVAIWKQPGFFVERGRLIEQLFALPADSTDWLARRLSFMFTRRIP